MEFLPQDATLDEIRVALAPTIASNAAFDGWTDCGARYTPPTPFRWIATSPRSPFPAAPST